MPEATPSALFSTILPNCFPLAMRILSGRNADPDAPGEVSQFQAMTAALAGTVGLGLTAMVVLGAPVSAALPAPAPAVETHSTNGCTTPYRAGKSPRRRRTG